MIYSFVGWVIESVYVSVHEKRFVNRGFLNGPVCPIYGVGAIIIILGLKPFYHNVFLLFICGVILTSALEYAVGYMMEKLFHAKWWDYSGQKFNLHGRISLLNSIYWGFLSVFLIKVMHPAFESLIWNIPKNIAIFIGWASFAFIIADTAVTIPTVVTLNTKLASLHRIYEELHSKLNFSPIISEKMLELHRKYNDSIGKQNFFHRRIIVAFPTLRSIKFDNILTQIKSRINIKK